MPPFRIYDPLLMLDRKLRPNYWNWKTSSNHALQRTAVGGSGRAATAQLFTRLARRSLSLGR